MTGVALSISLPCLRSFQAVYLRCEDWPSIFLSHLEVPPHCEFCLQVNNGLDASSLSLLPDTMQFQPLRHIQTAYLELSRDCIYDNRMGIAAGTLSLGFCPKYSTLDFSAVAAHCRKLVVVLGKLDARWSSGEVLRTSGKKLGLWYTVYLTYAALFRAI